MKKKTIFGVAACVVVLLVLWILWACLASPTKIALVNFQDFQVAKMVRSTENGFVKARPISVDELSRVKKYDAVLVFGMGLRITGEERALLQKIADKGVPFYSFATTSPDNNICNLDSVQASVLEDYLGNGGTSNYRSMFNYIRKELCGKSLFTGAVDSVKSINPDCLFHIGEDLAFNTVAEYESYLKEKGLYKEGQKKIALLTGIAGPFNTNTEHLDAIIAAFQDRGYRMYPIASFMKRLEFLREIQPDAAIYLPHGRLAMGQGERAVQWLQQNNIPLFCPLTMNATYDRWRADKQGMSGGFLSQSLVMPELDGGILPYALIAQYKDKDGIYLFKAVPERLEGFCNTVEAYLNLRTKANKDKKIALYYFKGPGSSALTAAGLEVLPSLYNVLLRLQQEGYDVSGLPASLDAFEKMLMERAPVFNSYAEGSMARYLSSGYPQWVKGSDLDTWIQKELLPESYAELTAKYGAVPGDYYTRTDNEGVEIAVTCIRFGNVVVLPQPVQSTGENSFQAVHGSNPVPPYPYIASYFWARNGFGADAMIHFGTHGSLEFVPGKQVALSSADWTDRLVGDVPHFYIYTIADVGEAMIAKRRSYAVTISHLSPPFMESGLGREVAQLQSLIGDYLAKAEDESYMPEKNLQIKKMAVKMGLHRDLELDSNLQQTYTLAEIQEIDNFATELIQEKIGAGLYTLGVPFAEDKILSSVRLIAKDPLAFSLAEVDICRGRIDRTKLKDQTWFARNYYGKAEAAVEKLLKNPSADIRSIMSGWGISSEEYDKACRWEERQKGGNPMAAMMASMSGSDAQREKAGKAETKEPKKKGGHPSWIPKTGKSPESTKPKGEGEGRPEMKGKGGHPQGMPKEAGMPQGMPKGMGMPPKMDPSEEALMKAILTLKSSLEKINEIRQMLRQSPEFEMRALMNALNGGYVAPTSGGDFIANPSAIPTGRNLYAINAETTPTAAAWEKGKKMGDEMMADYAAKHGKIPSKVSFTLWSGSFIESEGATLAQILYLLGVEPVRDRFGRVLDVQLIPQEELGRPRIDVVVQTSGQFRDLAASRLELLQRAIAMAAASEDKGDNFVAQGNVAAEKVLLAKGYSPKEARELSSTRVFGGLNGSSGTGITGMVQAGDRWEKESEISETYLHNMGAMYSSSQDWGDFKEGLFEAALQNTDVVIQPRQSNTWGALSLDHVYEFMGGLTLTVRNVTGKDPDNYFNDLRNRYNARVQDLRSAIGVESRTTFFNPNYIKEQMKGGASAAAGFTELVENTYGWNVMKPSVIDNQMWDQVYDVYVKDVNNLGVRKFFENESPAALQEMTAVMMETARKGYWKASEAQLADIAKVHAELVEKYGACCNGFTCGNALLKDFMSQKLDPEQAQQYKSEVRKALHAEPIADNGKSVVLEKEQKAATPERALDSARIILIVFAVVAVAAVAASVVLIRKKKKNAAK
ncbi:MAG: cobaltochelatase subunit CobN [Bacteroides sp.]|nr:cobaltochelatase subunit CobN [Ruminococcus flavefaciens]MCM1553887.1 cobaltochelatase subunit CobN [Bacteroides sp.]